MNQSVLIISPPSYSFAVLNLSTLALIYAKFEENLYIKWWFVFCPSTIFFALKAFQSLYFLSKIRILAQQFNLSELRLQMIWKITQFMIFSCLIFFSTFLGQFLERLDKNDKKAKESFKHIAAILGFVFIIYFGYSWSVKQMIFHEKSSILPQSDDKQEENKNNFFQQVINAVFTLMGNTMSICAGGACNSFYVSTFSAFFSAFGIPIFEYLHYFNFLAFILMGIQLFSLYTVKYSVKYLPFIIALTGAILISIDMLIYDCDYLTYLGNILLIFSAVYNSKLNKRVFGRKK